VEDQYQTEEQHKCRVMTAQFTLNWEEERER